MSSDRFLDKKRLKKLDLELQSLISRVGIDRKTEDEVFYVTELIDVAFQNAETNLSKEDVLVVLIKYLENGMLIPLPPPPEDPF